MALPRFSAITQALMNRRNPATAPGTKLNAAADYLKSPILGGLPRSGAAGLYNKTPGQLNLYKSKNPVAMAALQKELAAQMQQPGGVQPVEPTMQAPNGSMVAALGTMVNKPAVQPVVDQVAGVQQQLRSSSTQQAPLVGGNKFFKPVV